MQTNAAPMQCTCESGTANGFLIRQHQQDTGACAEGGRACAVRSPWARQAAQLGRLHRARYTFPRSQDARQFLSGLCTLQDPSLLLSNSFNVLRIVYSLLSSNSFTLLKLVSSLQNPSSFSLRALLSSLQNLSFFSYKPPSSFSLEPVPAFFRPARLGSFQT